MQIVNIPNSMTVLPELLPLSIEMVCLSCLGMKALGPPLQSLQPAITCIAGINYTAWTAQKAWTS